MEGHDGEEEEQNELGEMGSAGSRRTFQAIFGDFNVIAVRIAILIKRQQEVLDLVRMDGE